jgi:hypothetical protein
MPLAETRGVRKRTPGNIDYNPASQGQGQLTPDPAIEKRFARFDIYQRKHQLKTVKAIVGRWALSVENDTGAYVRAVEANTRIRPGAEVDLTKPAVMAGFAKAMIHHESAGFVFPAGRGRAQDLPRCRGFSAYLLRVGCMCAR